MQEKCREHRERIHKNTRRVLFGIDSTIPIITIIGIVNIAKMPKAAFKPFKGFQIANSKILLLRIGL